MHQALRPGSLALAPRVAQLTPVGRAAHNPARLSDACARLFDDAAAQAPPQDPK